MSKIETMDADLAMARIRKLEIENARLAGIIRKLEWSAYAGNDHDSCPACGRKELEGHDGDCEIGQVLHR